MSESLEITKYNAPAADFMTEIEHFQENDANSGKPQGSLYITSEHSNLLLKLEDEIDGVLHELKRSQKLEYRLAEQKLKDQKDLLLSLYQQREAERSKLTSPMRLDCVTDGNNVPTGVLNSVDQIKPEEAKFMKMIRIARGFGGTRRSVLSEHFGLSIND